LRGFFDQYTFLIDAQVLTYTQVFDLEDRAYFAMHHSRALSLPKIQLIEFKKYLRLIKKSSNCHLANKDGNLGKPI
jgi:hypothetical protein